MKTCTVCAKVLPKSAYYKQGKGQRPWCKACDREKNRRWREANREQVREKARLWREANREHINKKARELHGKHRKARLAAVKKWRDTTLTGYFSKRLASLRTRRRTQNGWEVQITNKDLCALYEAQNGCCALTGERFILQAGDGERLAPSVDRINQRKGYRRGNIRLITLQANVARNRWSDDQLYAFAEALLTHRKE